MMSKVNKLLIILGVVLGISFFLGTLNFNYLLFIPLVLSPLIFKNKPNVFITITLIYFYLAVFLGLIYGLYRTTNFYDTFIHLLWGFITGYLAIMFLEVFKKYDKKFIVFNTLFILIFSLAVSAGWEIFEFICDELFNSDMQRAGTGLFDTMKDITAGAIGTLVFNLYYFCETKSNKSGIVDKLVMEVNKI